MRSKTKHTLATFHKLMLATSGDQPFNDPEWIYEIKRDGYCAIADVNKKHVKLYSRNGLSFKSLYPLIAKVLSKLKINAVLDGEMVVFKDNNKPGFQRLQQVGELKKGKLAYYVFDCLFVNGNRLCINHCWNVKKF